MALALLSDVGSASYSLETRDNGAWKPSGKNPVTRGGRLLSGEALLSKTLCSTFSGGEARRRVKNSIVSFFLLILFLSSVAQTSVSQTRPRRTEKTATEPNTSTRPEADSSPEDRAQSADIKDRPEEIGEGEVLRINTTLVTIPVSVMDRDGRFIPDLEREDFRLYEEGVEQKIAYFQSVETPFTVVFMLDTSASTWSKLGQIKDAATAFLDQLRPDDKVMVFSFARGLTLVSEPTSDHVALRKAIQGIGRGMSTHLYDAVEKVLKKYLGDIKGRKAIVLFTDGVDARSNDATYESNLRDVEELDALVFPIRYDTYSAKNDNSSTQPPPSSARLPSILRRLPLPLPTIGGSSSGGGASNGSSRADYERGREYLYSLAERTGGRAYEANKDKQTMDEAFRQIAEELRRQYSLGYYPKVQGRAGERRRIRVRVERSGAAVRARDSYIFTPKTPANRDSSVPTAAQDKETQPSQPMLKKSPFVVMKR